LDVGQRGAKRGSSVVKSGLAIPSLSALQARSSGAGLRKTAQSPYLASQKAENAFHLLDRISSKFCILALKQTEK
jgi:hypothetical protein